MSRRKRLLKKALEPRLEEAQKGTRAVFFVDAAHFVLIPDPAECDLFGGFQAAAPVLYRGKRLEGAMRTPVRLREDYDAQRLRALAKASQDANQTRRLLALAAIYDGAPRSEVAKIGGVGVQTIRDWVLAFNAKGPPGLIDGKAPGNRPLLNAEQREALKQIVESGPKPAVDGVVCWRLVELAQGVFAEFGISVRVQTLSRILGGMGYRTLPARPRHHAQDPAALEAFKKTSSRVWKRLRITRLPASL